MVMMDSIDVMPLFEFNILSVVVYIFCSVLCVTGHVLLVYISIIAEVTAYTILSTYYIGLRCGTYCFLFSIVPIIIYLGCFLFKGKMRWHIVILLLLNFGLFAFLYAKFNNIRPVYEVPPMMRTIIVIFSSFVMVFSTIFYNIIYIYSSELRVKSLELQNKQLSLDASEDLLTSLLNRRGFLPIVEELMKQDKPSDFCISFCDIDNFKRINDSYGHDAGDEVLRHITKIITNKSHGCDVCRWGGEEILILMRDCDINLAREKMEELRRSIESSPTIFFNKRIFATITIGIGENKEGYVSPDDVIRTADARMYYGKQHGKNIVVFEDRE